MKIKYEFATETVEVEVSEELGTVIVDLDRREYNINHKETRRHCSLDAFNLDDTLFPSDENVEAETETKDQYRRLYDAMAQKHPLSAPPPAGSSRWCWCRIQKQSTSSPGPETCPA